MCSPPSWGWPRRCCCSRCGSTRPGSCWAARSPGWRRTRSASPAERRRGPGSLGAVGLPGEPPPPVAGRDALRDPLGRHEALDAAHLADPLVELGSVDGAHHGGERGVAVDLLEELHRRAAAAHVEPLVALEG